MAIICVGMIMIIFMDTIRNFFLGMGLITETMIAEVSNIVLVLVCGYVGCFSLNLGFTGLLFGAAIG